MIQGYEIAAVFDLLGELHMPALSEDQLCALAARAAGVPFVQIGAWLAMDERTARSLVEAIDKTLAMGCGLPHRDAFVTGVWFVVHATCKRRCTAAGMAMLRGGPPPGEAESRSEKRSEKSGTGMQAGSDDFGRR